MIASTSPDFTYSMVTLLSRSICTDSEAINQIQNDCSCGEIFSMIFDIFDNICSDDPINS